ncbi:hypothetical protein NFI96_008592, partial [Prochilodus magdalenae]
ALEKRLTTTNMDLDLRPWVPRGIQLVLKLRRDHTMARTSLLNLTVYELRPDDPRALTDYFIRLSIFLISAVCAGVPALVWALMVLRRHRKRKGRIPVFIVLLLLNDVLELLLNPYVATKLILRDWCRNMTCWTFANLWWGLRYSGVHLQLMVVFEGVLARRHPSCSAHVFFPPCSILISVVVFVYCFLCEFLRAPEFLLLSVLPLLAEMVTSWIMTCRSPPIKDPRSNRTEKQDCTALAFTTVTMIIYLSLITLSVFIKIWYMRMMTHCLLSLRVIIDPLLCVLVIREGHLSTDQTTDQDDQPV